MQKKTKRASSVGARPAWAGTFFRDAKNLIGKEWVTVPEAMTWVYCGRFLPAWRWSTDLAELPDELPKLPIEELMPDLFRGVGGMASVIREATKIELLNATFAANENAYLAPHVYACRSSVLGRVISDGARGEVSAAAQYAAAQECAALIAPMLKSILDLFQLLSGNGFLAVSGLTPSNPRRPLSEHYFSERTRMLPYGMLIHETEGLIASELRIFVHSLSTVFPAGAVREVDPAFLKLSPRLEAQQRIMRAEQKRARGGAPGLQSRRTFERLFRRLRLEQEPSVTIASMVRALYAAAEQAGLHDDLSGESTLRRWIARWRTTGEN